MNSGNRKPSALSSFKVQSSKSFSVHRKRREMPVALLTTNVLFLSAKTTSLENYRVLNTGWLHFILCFISWSPDFFVCLWNVKSYWHIRRRAALLFVSIFLSGHLYIYNHRVLRQEWTDNNVCSVSSCGASVQTQAQLCTARTNDRRGNTFKCCITFGVLANFPFLVSLMRETSNRSVSCNHKRDLSALWEQHV